MSNAQTNELPDAQVVNVLVENHRAFLRYLERKTGDRALAEDILQEAFTKVVASPGRAPAPDATVPWFYRMLRNAAIDQFRRRGARDRALAAFSIRVGEPRRSAARHAGGDLRMRIPPRVNPAPGLCGYPRGRGCRRPAGQGIRSATRTDAEQCRRQGVSRTRSAP